MLQISKGVPQGSVLGPLLFIIYMIDISFASNIFKLVIYADDCTLYSILSAFHINCNNINNVSETINSELTNISDWLKSNKLALNASKSNCMMFHMPQKHIRCPKFKINQVEIEQVKDFHFLGIVINEQLNWKSHVKYIPYKITITYGIQNRLKLYLPLHIKLSLYNSLILSHINYGILAWDM